MANHSGKRQRQTRERSHVTSPKHRREEIFLNIFEWIVWTDTQRNDMRVTMCVMMAKTLTNFVTGIAQKKLAATTKKKCALKNCPCAKPSKKKAGQDAKLQR